MKKTRVAYGINPKNGQLYILCRDTVEAALGANMMVRDWEKSFVKQNPQFEITFKVEKI